MHFFQWLGRGFCLSALSVVLFLATAMNAISAPRFVYLDSIVTKNGIPFIRVKNSPYSHKVIDFELSPEWEDHNEAGLSNLKKLEELALSHSVVPLTFEADEAAVIRGGFETAEKKLVIHTIEVRPDMIKTNAGKDLNRVTLVDNGSVFYKNQSSAFMDRLKTRANTFANTALKGKNGFFDQVTEELRAELPSRMTFEIDGVYYFDKIVIDNTQGLKKLALQVKKTPGSKETFLFSLERPVFDEVSKNNINDWTRKLSKLGDKAPVQYLAALQDLSRTRLLPIEIQTIKGSDVVVAVKMRHELFEPSVEVSNLGSFIVKSDSVVINMASGIDLSVREGFENLEKVLPTVCQVKLGD